MSAYTFERSLGSVHIKMQGQARCVACVRMDAFDIVWTEAYAAGIAAARAIVERHAQAKEEEHGNNP